MAIAPTADRRTSQTPPMVSVRYLFDEHLPRTLVQALDQHGCDCRHVCDVGLRKTPDAKIFDFALENGAMVVTRDWRDFTAIAHGRWKAQLPIPLVVLAYNYPVAVDAGALRQFNELFTEIAQAAARLTRGSTPYAVLDPSIPKMTLHRTADLVYKTHGFGKRQRREVVAHGDPFAKFPLVVGALHQRRPRAATR